jgi:hypothetical protein
MTIEAPRGVEQNPAYRPKAKIFRNVTLAGRRPAGWLSWGTASSADYAVLLTLPPGSYTAEVSGACGDTCIALVEVYLVP